MKTFSKKYKNNITEHFRAKEAEELRREKNNDKTGLTEGKCYGLEDLNWKVRKYRSKHFVS